jgi:beta-glucosidase-like glycosyl hydrolase
MTTARRPAGPAPIGTGRAAHPITITWSNAMTEPAAAPVKQRADCTELEWAEQERARFERLYTREYTRAEQAEDLLKVAHETSNRSEAERASAVQRAERAEAEVERLTAELANLRTMYDAATAREHELIEERDEAQAQANLDALADLLPPADRAAILTEAADDLATAFGDPTAKHIGIIAASHLRRRARELEGGQAGEEQPETPLEKRFRYSERRNDELRAECKRRGRINLEYAEKIERLEKQLDEVRGQLGAEILRAGQAETELRRLAAEAQPTTRPETEA